MTNLVTNAFRYGEAPVRVHAEQTDRHLRLSVEDCGPGVPSGVRPRPVRAVHARRGDAGSAVGTGLGLAIARSYARRARGDLLYEDGSRTAPGST